MRLASLLLALSFCLGFAAPQQQDSKSGSGKESDKAAVEVKHPSRIRLGGVYVGAGLFRFGGHPNYYYYPAYYAGFDPFFYPYYPLFTETQFFRSQPQGRLQLVVDPPSAEMFIDGAYAGLAQDLEKISLPVGAYTLRFSQDGFLPFEQRIYVLSTKKLKLDVHLTRDNGVQP